MAAKHCCGDRAHRDFFLDDAAISNWSACFDDLGRSRIPKLINRNSASHKNALAFLQE